MLNQLHITGGRPWKFHFFEQKIIIYCNSKNIVISKNSVISRKSGSPNSFKHWTITRVRKPWLTIISSAVANLRLPDDQHLTKIQIKFSIWDFLTRQSESTRSVGDDYNLRNLEFELFWLLWPPLIPLICNKATNDILMKFHVMVTWLSLVIITTTITWGHAGPLGHMTHHMICRNAFSDQWRCHRSEKQGHHCPLDHSIFF